MNDADFILWQVKLWDRFAKSSPIFLLLLASIFYLLGHRDWDLFLYICLGIFASVMFAWWFWVLYTIAVIVYTINSSGKSLNQIVEEIREIRRAIDDRKNRHNR